MSRQRNRNCEAPCAEPQSRLTLRISRRNFRRPRIAFPDRAGACETQAELKYLDETCHKELGCTLARTGRKRRACAGRSHSLAETEQRCQEAHGRRSTPSGPVNTQALEEFEEAQQRYDFLNAQRQDLLDSIRDTEKAIHEIDVESRKRFTEAFEIINANFREMFKTSLRRRHRRDAADRRRESSSESGIDIVASPPGKKLQSVLLLSGGESALTAMALLMAIFHYQPSPFCILDEVDAPLDEANIDRFTRLMKEMSSQTQFIVITHSKRTMESAPGPLRRDHAGTRRIEARVGEVQSPPPPPPPVMQPQLVAN